MADVDWRKNLRHFRKKLGKTQTDIAMHLNLRQQTIVGYENGPTNPSIDDLIKITDYLGITITDLFSYTEVKERQQPVTGKENKENRINNKLVEELLWALKAQAADLKEIKARLKAIEEKVGR